jgi:hypothetical protein
MKTILVIIPLMPNARYGRVNRRPLHWTCLLRREALSCWPSCEAGIHMASNHSEIEKWLCDAADEMRTNSKLKSSEYSPPVLGLIVLRHADQKFSHAEKQLNAKRPANSHCAIGKTDYQ